MTERLILAQFESAVKDQNAMVFQNAAHTQYGVAIPCPECRETTEWVEGQCRDLDRNVYRMQPCGHEVLSDARTIVVDDNGYLRVQEAPNNDRIHADPITVTGTALPHGVMAPAQPQNARDRFIEVLKSRRMLKPGEESVIDANLNAFAHELAEQQRAVNFDWYEDDAAGAVMARDHLADLIDPETP